MGSQTCCKKCLSFTGNFIRIFFGSLIGIICAPIVLPFLLILWLWRTFIVGCIWTLKGGEVTTASGMEAMWGLDDSGARAVITCTLILKGQVNITQVRTLLENNILNVVGPHGGVKYPRFRQHLRQVVGVFVWLPDRQFCIRRHVRTLPDVKDEAGLINTAAKLANTPLPSHHAQWEVLLIPINKYTGSPTTPIPVLHPMAMSTPLQGHKLQEKDAQCSHTALLLRLHHALGDGRSLVQLMLSALVDTKKSESSHIDPVLEKSNKCYNFLRTLWAFTQLPWVALRLMIRNDRSPLHGIELSGVKRLAWAPPINLQHFRTIKNHTNATVNDSLLTCVAAAVHR